MSNESMLFFVMGLTSLRDGFCGAGWCGRIAGPCGSSFAVAREYVGSYAMAVCVVRARALAAHGGVPWLGPRREGAGAACKKGPATFFGLKSTYM